MVPLGPGRPGDEPCVSQEQRAPFWWEVVADWDRGVGLHDSMAGFGRIQFLVGATALPCP